MALVGAAAVAVAVFTVIIVILIVPLVDVVAVVVATAVSVVAVLVVDVFVVVYLLPLLRNLSIFFVRKKKSIELIVTNFAEILRIGEIFWGPILFKFMLT